MKIPINSGISETAYHNGSYLMLFESGNEKFQKFCINNPFYFETIALSFKCRPLISTVRSTELYCCYDIGFMQFSCSSSSNFFICIPLMCNLYIH